MERSLSCSKWIAVGYVLPAFTILKKHNFEYGDLRNFPIQENNKQKNKNLLETLIFELKIMADEYWMTCTSIHYIFNFLWKTFNNFVWRVANKDFMENHFTVMNFIFVVFYEY